MLLYAPRLWSTPFGRRYGFVSGIVAAIMGFAGTTFSAPIGCAPLLGLLAIPVTLFSLLFLALGIASIVQSERPGTTLGILMLAAGACAVALAAADLSVASILLDLQRGLVPDVPIAALVFSGVAAITAAVLAFAAVAVRAPRPLGAAFLFGLVFAGPVPCSVVALVIFVRLGLPLSA